MINEMLEVMTALTLEGMTMMVVTHEMGFARKVADRMIFMEQGDVVQDCPTGDSSIVQISGLSGCSYSSIRSRSCHTETGKNVARKI
jgi:ABC-type polar amino acid transport system ATPase subunit